MNPDIWRIAPDENGHGGQMWRTFACELSAELSNIEKWIGVATKRGKLDCGHGLKNLELFDNNGSGCRICIEALKGEHVSD